MLLWPSQVIMTETTWPTKQAYLLSGLLQTFANPLSNMKIGKERLSEQTGMMVKHRGKLLRCP